MSGTFLYFGYGSNLLRQRLQLMNPSAEFVSIGELKGYRFGFTTFDEPTSIDRWRGGAATIIPTPDSRVWGCIWRLGQQDLSSLDRQEGKYKPTDVEVTTPDGNCQRCRTYIAQPNCANSTFDIRPSPYYLDVIVRGAKQNNLPTDYLSFLESIETNGYSGECSVYEDVLKLISQT